MREERERVTNSCFLTTSITRTPMSPASPPTVINLFAQLARVTLTIRCLRVVVSEEWLAFALGGAALERVLAEDAWDG